MIFGLHSGAVLVLMGYRQKRRLRRGREDMWQAVQVRAEETDALVAGIYPSAAANVVKAPLSQTLNLH